MPSFLAMPSRMRLLAWCGTKRSISSGAYPVVDQRLLDDAGNLLHRVAEHLAPVHAQVAGGLGGARTAVDVEQVLEAPIRADARGQDAAIVAAADLRLGLQHQGAGTVAEQHAGAAILPIENARERLCADHQGALRLAALDEVVGDVRRIDEARADRLHVEGGTLGYRRGRPGSCTAVAGNVRSGVAVAQMTRSISIGIDAGAHQGLARGAQCRDRRSARPAPRYGAARCRCAP